MSCLFNSLSYFIPLDSYTIRQQICNYLESNNPIIEDMETKIVLSFEYYGYGKSNENHDNNSKLYISSMRKPNTWGGAIEIQAACNIWNYRIIVLNYRDFTSNIQNNIENTIEFVPLHGRIDKTIRIEWNGGHYEPVRV